MRKYIGNIVLILLLAGISGNAVQAEGMGDIDIHGFISQGYLQTNNNNFLAETEDGTFEFNEMGINFGTDLRDDLRLGVQFFARDLGETGNDEITLDWASVDYNWRDWLGIRIGRNKAPNGFYGLTRDMDMLRLNVFLPQAIYNEQWRDAFNTSKGVAVYGQIFIGPAGRLAYDLIYGLPDLSADSDIASAYEDAAAILGLEVTDMKSEPMAHACITWYTPVEGLRAKASYYALNDIETNGTFNTPLTTVLNLTDLHILADLTGYYLSLEYATENFTLAGEFRNALFETKWDMGHGLYEGDDRENEGWYVSAAYRFNPYFECGLTYGEYVPDVNNKDGKAVFSGENYYDRLLMLTGQPLLETESKAWQKTTTFSTRFDLTESWLVKLEASYNDGFGIENNAKNPDGLDRYWVLYAAKVTYNF